MSREWRTESGREYRTIMLWECQQCYARLDDEGAVRLHEAWHGLMAQRGLAKALAPGGLLSGLSNVPAEMEQVN